MSENKSFSLIIHFDYRLALKLCHPGAIDKSRRRLMIRVIQFVSVFCDWGRMNPYYLHSVNSNATLQNTSNLVEDSTSFLRAIEILRASGEQLRAENRTRSSLRVTVADMKSYLSKLFQNHSNEDSSKLTGSFQSSLDSRPILGHGLSLPLPEYIELRGYIPLNDYEVTDRLSS